MEGGEGEEEKEKGRKEESSLESWTMILLRKGLVINVAAITQSLLMLYVSGYYSPIMSHEKLCENQMEWISGPIGETPLGDFANLELPEFKELGLLPKEVVSKISKTLQCASENINQESVKCKGFEWVQEHRVILSKDDSQNRLFFGYNFFINRPELDADHFRNVIFERANKAWSLISKVIAENPTFQQFHVGFASGGSMAYLIANRVLSSHALPFYEMTPKNNLNQVQVVSFEEVGVFTDNVVFDPVGPTNHGTFLTRKKQDDGYALFGTHILIAPYKLEKSRMDIPIDRLARFSSQKEALARLKAMNKDDRKEYKDELVRQLNIAELIAFDFGTIFSEKSFDLFGAEQISCARNLGDQLEEFLPHDEKSVITCKVFKRPNTKVDKNNFSIKCSLKVHDGEGETISLASYGAQLTTFTEREAACKALKVSKPVQNAWSQCINDLVVNSDELSLILPYNSKETDNCRFIGEMSMKDWNTQPKGCIIKPQASEDPLHKLYDEMPGVFFSLIPAHSMFPESCNTVIGPMFFLGDALKEARKILHLTADYFNEMFQSRPHSNNNRNIINNDNNNGNSNRNNFRSRLLPELFIQHDTENFQTSRLDFSSHHFLADDEVARKILTCVNSEHSKLLDCSSPSNQWIPGFCPEFCSAAIDNEQRIELCDMMMHCPALDAFIGFKNEILATIQSYVRTTALDQIRASLGDAQVAQYVLYRFTSHGLIKKNYSEYTVGIFFTQMPEIQSIPIDNRRKRHKTREQQLDDDEIWHRPRTLERHH